MYTLRQGLIALLIFSLGIPSSYGEGKVSSNPNDETALSELENQEEESGWELETWEALLVGGTLTLTLAAAIRSAIKKSRERQAAEDELLKTQAEGAIEVAESLLIPVNRITDKWRLLAYYYTEGMMATPEEVEKAFPDARRFTGLLRRHAPGIEFSDFFEMNDALAERLTKTGKPGSIPDWLKTEDGQAFMKQGKGKDWELAWRQAPPHSAEEIARRLATLVTTPGSHSFSMTPYLRKDASEKLDRWLNTQQAQFWLEQNDHGQSWETRYGHATLGKKLAELESGAQPPKDRMMEDLARLYHSGGHHRTGEKYVKIGRAVSEFAETAPMGLSTITALLRSIVESCNKNGK